MSLTKLLSKIREQNMAKPLPKPKTRPETDEEFQYRAFHTPFYCKDCGTIIYPEWVPELYDQISGEPEAWKNVSICGTCRVITSDVVMNRWWNGWRIYPIATIHRKDIEINEPTKSYIPE